MIVKTLSTLIIASLPWLLWPAQGRADPSMAVAWEQDGEHWQSLQTENFNIHYLQPHELAAQRAAAIAEHAWQRLTQRLNWTPDERIEMVLTDDHDGPNGWAHVEPFNQIRLFLSPPDGHTTLEVADDWLHLLITHELTHILHIDMVRGFPAKVRAVFGRHSLTFPHAYTPGFLLEGLAVYEETNAQAGYGRGQDVLFEMMMRSEVRHGSDSLSELTAAQRDWPFGKHYLYGYYYWQFIADTYGEQAIRDYLSYYARNIVPFFWLNHDARRIFGKSHEQLWPDFQYWLQQRFDRQIQAIDGQPLSTLYALSQDGQSLESSASDGRYYYFFADNGEDRRQLLRLNPDSQQSTPLVSSDNLLDFDVSKDGDIIVSKIPRNYSGHYWADLYRLQDGELHRLTQQSRYRQVRWLNSENGLQILAKKIVAGVSQLDVLDRHGQYIRTLWQGSIDDVLGDYSVSSDGRTLVASIKRKQQGWNLERLSLQQQNSHWQALTNTLARESAPSFIDNDTLVFSANYDGHTINVYQLRLKSGSIQRLANTDSGLFKPVKVNGQLIAQHYSATGYDHVLISEQPQAIETAPLTGQYDYPADYLIADSDNEVSDYSPWSSLRPRHWNPQIVLRDDVTLLGLGSSGADALNRHNYDVNFAYDSQQDLLQAELLYQYDSRWRLLLSRVHEYRYQDDDDSNAPLDSIGRTDTVELTRQFSFGLWQFTTGINRSLDYDLEQDGLTQKHSRSYNSVAGLRLDVNNLEAFSQSIGISYGTELSLVLESHDAFDNDYQGERFNAAFSHYFDLPGNHILALHGAGALGDSNAKPFRLGGHQSATLQSQFGRDRWFLRGYDSRVQSGNRLQVNSIEYRFPIANVERGIGTWPIALGGIHSTVFVDSGAAWSEQQSPDYLTGAGIEVMTEVLLMYGFQLPVRLGHAVGFDKDDGKQHSYLAIGYQF